MEALAVGSVGGGIMLFPRVVWFLVDTSSTSSIGVSSIVVRVTTLVRLMRLHAQLSIGFKQLLQMSSRWLEVADPAPALSAVVVLEVSMSVFLSLLLKSMPRQFSFFR